jgi:hypothetical protein
MDRSAAVAADAPAISKSAARSKTRGWRFGMGDPARHCRGRSCGLMVNG